jgi:hypothetical protein
MRRPRIENAEAEELVVRALLADDKENGNDPLVCDGDSEKDTSDDEDDDIM